MSVNKPSSAWERVLGTVLAYSVIAAGVALVVSVVAAVITVLWRVIL